MKPNYNKQAFILLIALLVQGFTFLQAQVFNGDLTLSSRAEVNGFDYTEVTGNLTISDADITDLTPLSSLLWW